VIAAVALLAAAPAARATFHRIAVREVYPGGTNNASYVELQMYEPGQEFVVNHHLVAYNPDGTVNENFKFPASVANAQNQATILVADTFQVQATDVDGTGLPTSYSWTVDLTAPEVTVLSGPEKPSSGNSAAFKYSSSEAGSTFQCSLEPTGESPVFTGCPSTGKTYPDGAHPAPLADGSWTFEVRATDKAGNQSTPEPFPLGTYTWTVDNSLAAYHSPTHCLSTPDSPLRQAPGQDARPHPHLPLPLGERRSDLSVQARRWPLQGLPLALHDQGALVWAPHAEDPRCADGRRPHPRQDRVQDRETVTPRPSRTASNSLPARGRI
jgi:hypothetical protein